jgi:hypothetical protein
MTGALSSRLLEQFGAYWMFAGDELEEAMQPRDQRSAGRRSLRGLRGGADGVDLVDVKGLEKFASAWVVAVEGCHADAGASRDFSHRHFGVRIGKGRAGRGEDLGPNLAGSPPR